MPGEMPAPSPSDVRVDAPAPPLAPPTTEVLKPKTPAEQLGLTDGQIVARRGKGENAYFDSGWSVLYTGTAIDTMTNQPREEIVIVKPVVDAEGNAVVDDTGVAESITKTYWLDDLMAMQPKPEQAANSGEDLDITVPRGLKKEVEEGGAKEIEGASDEAADLGGAALTTEVAVDSIPPDATTEPAVEVSPELAEAHNNLVRTKLGELYAFLNRMQGQSDANVSRLLEPLIYEAQRTQPDDIASLYEGVGLGRAVTVESFESLSRHILTKLAVTLKGDTKALNLAGNYLDGRLSDLRYARGMGPNSSQFTETKRGDIMHALSDHARRVPNIEDLTNQGRRVLLGLFSGMALGLSNPDELGYMAQSAERALKV